MKNLSYNLKIVLLLAGNTDRKFKCAKHASYFLNFDWLGCGARQSLYSTALGCPSAENQHLKPHLK